MGTYLNIHPSPNDSSSYFGVSESIWSKKAKRILDPSSGSGRLTNFSSKDQIVL